MENLVNYLTFNLKHLTNHKQIAHKLLTPTNRNM